ncbi:phage virion morphogenesis protein [Serratia fonticola]|uniref:Phage virion morphogenesis protein n=1 Tax=Serratia fonticola TaxID=47917 RepID=A0A542D857_SERFO|nr:phage virion morphogenesis protein [Serratia fonticola]TQI78708.1 phage virion morphogenesis protein [Serratia fonticola]TQI99270.1 phage virion morphogenesis protein [Serratia fonticola]TVZ68795.1 phage virion morphogenesis protein [Serratia fonticola]
MAGATLSFNSQSALDALLNLEAKLDNPAPMFAEMGEELLDIHQARFDAQISPEGVPWTPLQPWYRDSKPRNQEKILTLDGTLRNTLRYQVRATELLFGTDRPYGAAHHFGAIIKPKTAQALNVGGRLVKKVELPARPWLGLSNADGVLLIDIARSYLQAQ